ncbi:uncharacterized protein BP01DRAFT_411142 [Aspergillus saccharolyticus JOP 1030-1]|uniref:ARM repeat-containing protein n=1 Tax=Aspergillus saccharolyticus JOP 1030-1 TaxID=1450539 RepID=A0A318ZHP3_9EURO|nr:hypothetical protein BP01DRAFT_411142 [Aspergillus saccharolyticus JOP 1030-1]PYH47091.1 hypothetical protein BP01DRAFT_411142 [Aspergillus saccharolyticus JOP 1030-1]
MLISRLFKIRALGSGDGLLKALFNREIVSETTIHEVVLLIDQRNSDIGNEVISALHYHADLPEQLVQGLLSHFKDDVSVDSDSTLAPILSPQKSFSDQTLRILGTFLTDDLRAVRCRAAHALAVPTVMLPSWIIRTLIHCLEDESEDVQLATRNALCTQTSLPLDALSTLVLLIDGMPSVFSSKLKISAHDYGRIRLWPAKKSLPDDTVLIMALLLDHDCIELRQRTILYFGAQETLRRRILPVLSSLLRAENSNVSHQAAEKLKKLQPLPDDILEDLVSCLKDHSAMHVASDILRSYEMLPPHIVHDLSGLLIAEDGILRQHAAIVLWNQKNLPLEVLHGIVRGLRHSDCETLSCAADLLERQRNISDMIVSELIQLLKDKRVIVPYRAAVLLLKQPHLAENILHDLALLIYSNGCNGYAFFVDLARRSDLPTQTVEALCFPPSSADLGRTALRTLLRGWVQVAIYARIYCYIWEGYLGIDGPRGKFMVSFASEQHREEFAHVMREVKAELGFPTFGEVEERP